MKILKTSHSEINLRQHKLSLELNKQVETYSICPTHWGDEIAPKIAIALEPKFVSEMKGISTFYLEGFVSETFFLNPTIIYCQNEPHHFFAKQCALAAKSVDAKLVFFTWENKPDIILHPTLKELEKENLSKADLVICGTKEAEQRIKSINPEVNTTVIPQTGIDTDHFKPYGNSNKEYDIGYVGRFTPEKMKYYIEFLKRNPKLKSLSVGGRGQCYPPGGTIISWTNYENLVIYYNQMDIFLHLPWSYHGFAEQFCYGISEALSCGLPVITTENGSLRSVYGITPNVWFVPEGKDGLKKTQEIVDGILSGVIQTSPDAGRQWVIDNLSLQAIAKRHLEVFESLK